MKARRDGTKSRARRALIFIFVFFAIILLLSIPPSLFFELGYVNSNQYMFATEAISSLAFLLSTIVYLKFFDRNKSKSILERLGLGRKGLTLKNVALGVLIFLGVLLLEFAVGEISQITGATINTNVAALFAGAPLWFYVFTCVITPINEETLFRGLLVPRLGIVLSSILFGIGHLTYFSTSLMPNIWLQATAGILAAIGIAYSIKLRSWQYAISIAIVALMFVFGDLGIDVIAAVIFGLLSGYIFRKTNSLYPSIIGHALVNTLTVILTFAPI